MRDPINATILREGPCITTSLFFPISQPIPSQKESIFQSQNFHQARTAKMTSTTQPITIRHRTNSDFLSLAPIQSSSYPAPPASDSARNSLSSSPEVSLVDGRRGLPVGNLPGMLKQAKQGRVVDGTASAGFLRLGPVHNGRDGDSDFSIA
ncbi:hypothetical protein EV356DRAFT_247594 [Viridothelium virens]|uniref:Uncharacterized protein n=1 Tax=Viridothelium virens TaxID=1048519 RepID=A0A6A6H318_VIRVR|nr:hypothetical protein EV356DRAFT_247594 [Viridothelium virens]